MPDLKVALELVAQDLMTHEVQAAIATLGELKAATAELNGTASPYGTADVTGEYSAQVAAARAAGQAGAEAGAATAAGAHEASAALEEEAGVFGHLKEEYVGGFEEMLLGMLAFEAGREAFDKIGETEREVLQVNRQLAASFGEASVEYKEFAERIQEGTNYTALQFEKAAAALAPLQRDYGVTDEQLKGLLATTADLAAANGVDLVQAANDVAASMRGQARAGVELHLNLRANVIQGMIELTEAEKAAAVGGDSVAGAQARLKVINLEAAGSAGQAAAAAGAQGDAFQKLDKTTAELWETLAAGGAAAGVADVFRSVASGAQVTAGAFGLVTEAVLSGTSAIGDAIAALQRYEQAVEHAGFGPPWSGGGYGWGGGSGGGTGGFADEPITTSGAILSAMDEVRNAVYAPTKADEEAKKALTTLQEAYRDESVRINAVTAALEPYTRAQEEAARAGVDFRDETVRAVEVQNLHGDALHRNIDLMEQYDLQLQTIGKDQGVAGGLLGDLQAARSLEYRMGTYHGEYDADILELRRRQQRLTLAGGAAADARVRAGLSAEAQGGDFYDVLKVDTQHVTAQNVYVNGSQGSIGQMSDISGGGGTAPVSDMISRRYENARSAGPWASTRGGGGL